MKLLFENWREYLNENLGREIWYHLTTPDRAKFIEEEGLKINQETCLTTETENGQKNIMARALYTFL